MTENTPGHGPDGSSSGTPPNNTPPNSTPDNQGPQVPDPNRPESSGPRQPGAPQQPPQQPPRPPQPGNQQPGSQQAGSQQAGNQQPPRYQGPVQPQRPGPSQPGSSQPGQHAQPGPSQQYGQQYPYRQTPPNSQAGPSQQYGYSQAGPGGPYNGPVPPGQQQRRAHKGPGWAGVIVAAIVAAVLAAGGTFGAVKLGQPDTHAASEPSSIKQQQNPGKASENPSPNWQQVASTVSPSVVAIKVVVGDGGELGSGIILSKDGKILTNNHVVADAQKSSNTMTVTTSDGKTYKASVLGTDPDTDLAVVKLDDAPSDLKPATLGKSGKLNVGQPVMALGNPLGLAGTVTTGIVSALNRPVVTAKHENGSENQNPASPKPQGTVVTNAIQTDAAINPGNSGGALVNSGGQVVGVNSSIVSLGGSASGQQSGSIGLGFAIPIDQAADIAQQLIDNGKAEHPFLGITLQTSQVHVGGAVHGSAKVISVVDGSGASDGGVRKNDQIIAINKTPVNDADSLIALIQSQKVGSTITITVVRNHSKQKLHVKLTAKESQ